MPNIINHSNNNVNGKELTIVFLGTPQFAVPILEKLAQSNYKPLAVFCAPDKPVGRKQILAPPPAKTAAQKYGIQVYQPENKNTLKSLFLNLKSDLVASAAYGLILPKEILDAPRYGCLNIHPSLLPKHRGPSPIQAAILNGDEETGVTIYKMDEKIDHGPILKNKILKIKDKRYTTAELSRLLSGLGANLLIETLPDWLAGKVQPKPQDESRATRTKIIKKQYGQIDWQKSAQEIERQIRAYTPWPGTFARLGADNLKLKIIGADISEKNLNKNIGEIFLIGNNELAIQTGKGALLIKKFQLEGGKPLDMQDFLRGHREIIGQILG